jgi:hypothetical protein
VNAEERKWVSSAFAAKDWKRNGYQEKGGNEQKWVSSAFSSAPSPPFHPQEKRCLDGGGSIFFFFF